MSVTWLTLGNDFTMESRSGITFCTIPRVGRRFKNFSFWFRVLVVVAICKIARVSCVCVDDWLFFRGDTSKFLAYEIALKKAGVRFVSDHRDPFIDFEISQGKLQPDGALYKVLVDRYHAIYRLSDLVIVPSHSYERIVVEEEGLDPDRVLGTFRGVDAHLFNPKVEPLNLVPNKEKSKFTIGWFGIMHAHRQMGEVLVPIIKTVGEYIRDAHVIIGGEGPGIVEFDGLRERYAERFSILGFIPYSILPRYIASCDVLLCPVDTRFRFSRTSIWLKIFETVAVGRPIIATRTEVSDDDLYGLNGVIWVDGSYESYVNALVRVHSEYQNYRALAIEQAKNFEKYTISRTIAKIVDRIMRIVQSE